MPSANYSIFFLVGMLFSASSGAVFLLGAVGLAVRRRWRVMAAAVGVISWIVLGTAVLVGGVYIWEFMSAWFFGNVYERAAYSYRVFGQYAWAYWLNAFCNVLAPQFFWFRYCRTNLVIALSICSLTVFPGLIERILTAFLSGTQ